MNSPASYVNVGDPTMLERCLAGEIFLIREFLQKTFLYELVMRATLEAIGKATNPQTEEQLKINGFDRLHHFVDCEDLERAVTLADLHLRTITPRVLARTIRRGFAYKKPLWVLDHPITRFFVPYDLVHDHRERFSQFRERYGDGRITTIRPHRDSWFVEPLTSINIWIAMGRVVPGNGISLYTETYDKPLNYERHLGVARDQPVGRPVNFTLCPGDALVFHAEHLHATEVNRTEHTRSVLSLRIALADPNLSSRNPRRYRKVHPRMPISFLALQPRFRHIQRRLSGFVYQTEATNHERNSSGSAEQTARETRFSDTPGLNNSSIAVSELNVEQPRAVSKDLCLVKLRDGEVRVLNRRCPHEGADLALGYLEGRQIVCPWHNLRFNLDTGESPCRRVGKIRVLPCEIRNGRAILPEACANQPGARANATREGA
jgi:nitrite reductase/ring-hydroxylating ferredoxin subunit